MIVPCAALWPAPGVHPENHWGHIAARLGYTWPLERPLLIGLRGVKMFAEVTHQPVHRATYEDTFVLLQGDRAPYLFRGSTTAYQAFSKRSPDVTGDGVGDVGSIRCGRYVLHLLEGQANGPIFELRLPDGSERIPCHRDTDHDGVISEAEARRSEEMRDRPQTNSDGCYATAVLFHPGYTSGRSSIACQTAAAESLRELAKSGLELDYELVNSWDVVPLGEDAAGMYAVVEPSA